MKNVTLNTEKFRAAFKKQYDGMFESAFQKALTAAITPTKQKDRTKFRFDGQDYGKGRLVLKVFEKLIATKQYSYDQLKEIFADEYGSTAPTSRFGIFQITKEARKRNASDSQQRYFFDTPLVTSDGQEIVVCSQWGIGNIHKFVKRANQKLGLKIKEVPNLKRETVMN
jgi:hypothetical protein